MEFTDTLQGDGLARLRLGRSSPLYPSYRPSEEEQRHHQERRIQLGREADASKPDEQFAAQIKEERRRIWNTDPYTSWRSMPPGDFWFKEVSESVKKRWVEQGIWNSKWNQFPYGRWKHEEPLELESESGADSEAGPSPFFSFASKSQPKLRPPKSNDEKRRITEQRVVQEREREASRPYYQFFYQILKERERIQEESKNQEGADITDINTRAYENIKNIWTERGIWNKRWGILPGMSWKHEEPLEEVADSSVFISETALRNAKPSISYKAGKVPFSFGPLPQVESDHLQETRDEEPLDTIPFSQTLMRNEQPPVNHEASGGPAPVLADPLVNGSHEAEDDDATILNGVPLRDINGRHIKSMSQGAIWARFPRDSTAGQALLLSNREASYKDGQPANVSLTPVHPSIVSEAARKKPQQRSQKVSSNIDIAEPQPSPLSDYIAPRRSKRIANSLAKIASTDPSELIVPIKTRAEGYK